MRKNCYLLLYCRVIVGAPTERAKASTDTSKPQGGVIAEPGPVLRAAVTTTNAMGSLYMCGKIQEDFR